MGSIKSLFKGVEYKQPGKYIPDSSRLYSIIMNGVLDIRESGLFVDVKVDHDITNQVIASVDISIPYRNPTYCFNFYDVNDDIISLLNYINSEYRTNYIRLSYWNYFESNSLKFKDLEDTKDFGLVSLHIKISIPIIM